MKNKIKFLFVILSLTLGFLFCFSLFSLSVSADEVAPETQEPKIEETTPQAQEEEENEEEIEVDKNTANFFLNQLKNLKWEEAEAIIGWIIAYLVANFGVLAGCLITIVLNKYKEFKTTKAFQEAYAKLSLENQQKIEAKEKEYKETLESLKAEILEQNQLNQQKLVELSNDQTKEIAKACASITADLTK